METLVAMAIDLGCQLQEDERFLALRAAQAAADADENLQKLIGDFNLKRMAINTEETKAEGERDAEKLRTLNMELRDIYATVMANEHMMAYNDARTALDALVNKLHAAISLAAQGQDPNLAAQESSCNGDCGSCGGCH